jgi:hypothetical protein
MLGAAPPPSGLANDPAPVLAAGDLRPHIDLSGVWHYSIDPYRTGAAGFHGEAPDASQRRYAEIDVAQAMRDHPAALYEFDMARAPTATLPSSWLTHSAEMRHYRGLVWYQRTFTADPKGRRAPVPALRRRQLPGARLFERQACRRSRGRLHHLRLRGDRPAQEGREPDHRRGR